MFLDVNTIEDVALGKSMIITRNKQDKNPCEEDFLWVHINL
jgi:hypothetical protein